MIFGLCVIAFMVIAGFAIDFGRAVLVRERLSHALDASILAVGSAPYLDDAEAQQLGEEFFYANFGDAGAGAAYDVNVSVVGDTVTMAAHANVPTILLGLIGQPLIEVNESAEVVRGGIDLELVMVLDNTGSMAGSKISALRTAATDATNILFASGGSNPDAVKIGLVPFAATVNVGSQNERAWWIDANAQSPLHALAHDFSAPVNRWDLFDQLDVAWAGCVETRAQPLDVDDTPPSLGDPSTLFVPYFQPDVPGSKHNARSGYSNEESWLDDGDWSAVMGGEYGYATENEARQANIEKYALGGTPWGDGPNTQCVDQPIAPLTTDKAALLSAISAMTANGYTNIPNAAGWGVRVLSPATPFTEGRPFGEEELVKAMILLTDGDNVLDGQYNHNYSRYSSYGFVGEERLGAPTSSDNTLTDRLDERTEAACAYAKSLGVRVYTITFQVSSSSTRDLMEGCASVNEEGDPLYWDSPSTDELQQTFRAIARDLVDLRLSK